MAQGKVKWFNEAKGYGFIEQDSGQDIFVHYTSIQSEGFRSLNKGEKVLFDLYDGQKVEMAKNVVRICSTRGMVGLPLAIRLPDRPQGIPAESPTRSDQQ